MNELGYAGEPRCACRYGLKDTDDRTPVQRLISQHPAREPLGDKQSCPPHQDKGDYQREGYPCMQGKLSPPGPGHKVEQNGDSETSQEDERAEDCKAEIVVRHAKREVRTTAEQVKASIAERGHGVEQPVECCLVIGHHVRPVPPEKHRADHLHRRDCDQDLPEQLHDPGRPYEPERFIASTMYPTPPVWMSPSKTSLPGPVRSR